jgi:hypothetical protein
MQYQSECFEALKSVSKVSKPFEKVLMDTLKLFMAIPGKVNFLQMGRYGEFSEQTYRNNFENEAFDWFAFNEYLVRKVLNGKFLAIAVDPSFLPKSGKKTPWIGRFWSGVAGEMKRGQEIFGVGVIDVENHDCMTLSAPQTPDAKSLEEMDYNLVEWYCQNLIILKEKPRSSPNTFGSKISTSGIAVLITFICLSTFDSIFIGGIFPPPYITSGFGNHS